MIDWETHLKSEMVYQEDPGPVLAYQPDQAAFQSRKRTVWDLPADVFAWTESRVYFILTEDEANLTIGSAPRNPPEASA